VLVPQPRDLSGRLALAHEYQSRFDHGTPILVDTMNNASWEALSKAPNLGLLEDQGGVVRAREGWFDRPAMEESLASLGIHPRNDQ